MLFELPFFASWYQKTWSKRAAEIIDQDLAFISLFLYFKSSDLGRNKKGNFTVGRIHRTFIKCV